MQVNRCDGRCIRGSGAKRRKASMSQPGIVQGGTRSTGLAGEAKGGFGERDAQQLAKGGGKRMRRTKRLGGKERQGGRNMRPHPGLIINLKGVPKRNNEGLKKVGKTTGK